MSSRRSVVHRALALLTPLCAATAMAQTIPFTPDRWDLTHARVVEHLGRQSLVGTAFLRDAAFENGVIEVDVAMTGGTRGYPGVLFRILSDEEHERIYLRPHRAPFYADAVQYVAAFHGVENTYISIFHLLGGLGVILGSAGPQILRAGLPAQEPGSQFDGFNDAGVAGAAAEITLQGLFNFVPAGIGIFVQQRLG